MDCHFVRVKPNTEQWDELRQCRLTASHAGDWLAGENTKRYLNYLRLKVRELLGFHEQEQSAPWYEHGKKMEPYARDAYKYKYDIDLTDEVFLIHKDYDWLSCSPDGVACERDPDDPTNWLTISEPMVEIKCRKDFDRYEAILVDQISTDNIESNYRPQVQCQMLVTGLDQIDFVNYYHDEKKMVRKMHVFPVERDQAMIDRIEEKAIEFMTRCYNEANQKLPESLRQ